MSSPRDPIVLSSSPTSILCGISPVRRRENSAPSDGDVTPHPRRSSIVIHSYDPNDPEVRERQRTMDVDMAMHLSRVRRETMTLQGPGTSPYLEPVQQLQEQPYSAIPHLSPHEQHYLGLAKGEEIHGGGEIESGHTADRGLPHRTSHLDLRNHHQTPDPSLLVSLGLPPNPDAENATASIYGLPTYQANASRFNYDFTAMEDFAADEKARLGIDSPLPQFPSGSFRPGAFPDIPLSPVEEASESSIIPPRMSRHRKLSQSILTPRHRKGLSGKMALFEGNQGHPQMARFVGHTSSFPFPSNNVSLGVEYHHTPRGSPLPDMGPSNAGHDRPYRFSFYSNALSSTIHARSLSELPADGQSFRDLFMGLPSPRAQPATKLPQLKDPTPPYVSSYFSASDAFKRGANVEAPAPEINSRSRKQGNNNGSSNATLSSSTKGSPSEGQLVGDNGDSEGSTWWLDVQNPTDEEMKMLSRVFSIHPLTTEDILMEEIREKIELFRNYYLVCFRSFDQDPYSPTHLEPLNMYIIVFREGILSFHFHPTPHPQNVRHRIKQLKDYIDVTSDWISYALIDDITDAFGPLIQSIEYEVDSIDELVLILRETEQSDMLRRIGTCRKKVMGLLRLMGNKADVVKGLAKRCNEHWRVAPTSDIGLYLSDIQDHLITMTQNLNHYEKILSRSHSNYLAQISIEMTDANNQINDVLSKLTALGTVLVPMNLITGLWGMNVHVPGEGIEGYAWFVSIVGCLAAFAVVGAYSAYRFMVRRA